jgi:predicted PurR-regulated permease PerM
MNVSDRIASRGTEYAGRLFEELPGMVTSFIANLLLVPLIAYFMIRDGKRMRRRVVDMVPNRYFEMTLMMFYRIDRQIGGYLRGRLIECSLVSVTLIVVMGIARLFVPLNQIFLISCVFGATNVIPYVGPVLGVAFGVLLYLGAGMPLSSIYVLVGAVLAAHLIDSLLIAPAVLSHNVDLHPLTSALVLVIGGETLGILGLFIAIPAAASLKVIAQEFYNNYRLHIY